MIAGETEMIWADHLDDASYDDFLFFGNKEKREARKAARKARRAERRADPKRIARKEKRKVFMKKLGQAYEDVGGGAAIGGAIDTLIRKPEPVGVSEQFPTGNAPGGSDFSVQLGDEREDTPKPKKSKSQTLLIAGGVVVVITVVGLVIYQGQKNKRIGSIPG